MGSKPGRVILSTAYDKGTMSAPAFLDLALQADDKVIYVTLKGKQAKKLSSLKKGDLYYEPDNVSPTAQ